MNPNPSHRFRTIKGLAVFLSVLMLVCLVPLFTQAPVQAATRESYRGIDVSQWQGSIDFAQVKSSGIEMVYIRSSEGSNYTDPNFRQNYENARAQGLLVGFYHYVTARNTQQAEQQAKYFLSVVSGLEFECRLAMDFEYLTGLSNEEINAIALAFMETLSQAGEEGVVYADSWNARMVFDSRLAAYPLWVAQYGSSSQPDLSGSVWNSWAGFQYSDVGNVAGITGNVDLDTFTSQMLRSDSEPVSPPDDPFETKHATTFYIAVRPFDNLTAIARRYNTTVDELVELNGIENPNCIYVGQVLALRTEGLVADNRFASLYLCQPGDTLEIVASKFGVSLDALASTNELAEGEQPETWRFLKIPPVTDKETLLSSAEELLRYTFFYIQNLSLRPISRWFHQDIHTLAAVNGLHTDSRIPAGTLLKLSSSGNRADTFEGSYIVQKGDTICGIGEKFGISPLKLIEANEISNPNKIIVGQLLRIPAKDENNS